MQEIINITNEETGKPYTQTEFEKLANKELNDIFNEAVTMLEKIS